MIYKLAPPPASPLRDPRYVTAVLRVFFSEKLLNIKVSAFYARCLKFAVFPSPGAALDRGRTTVALRTEDVTKTRARRVLERVTHRVVVSRLR